MGWVDWINHTRIHSSLDSQTPAEIEAEHSYHVTAVEQPLPTEMAV